jgi:transposase
VFLSLFKSPASVITAAELLAAIGDCRARYPTRDALATDAGHAAVAHESGKWKAAGFRRACNKRLRVAFCRLADSSRARSAPSDAPGAVWCGSAGATTPHTTRRATARCNATSP